MDIIQLIYGLSLISFATSSLIRSMQTYDIFKFKGKIRGLSFFGCDIIEYKVIHNLREYYAEENRFLYKFTLCGKSLNTMNIKFSVVRHEAKEITKRLENISVMIYGGLTNKPLGNNALLDKDYNSEKFIIMLPNIIIFALGLLLVILSKSLATIMNLLVLLFIIVLVHSLRIYIMSKYYS